MPAQSVVAVRSNSRLSCLATYAKNGSYAFLVSVGVGWSGPTPKRSLLPCASENVVGATSASAKTVTRASAR